MALATHDERDATMSRANNRDAKTERLVARATPSIKSMLERASYLEGRTLSDFILHSATEAAAKSIATHEEIVLAEHERQSFFNALLHPSTPSPKALDAARRYRKAMQQSG